jgi:hypothetical protein
VEDTNRRVMWHGMFLFLLGLLTGFAEPRFANMRMGLAAHLEGVMNGTFLIALGAIWNHIRLSPRAKTIAFWSALLQHLCKLASHHSRRHLRHRGPFPHHRSRPQWWSTLAGNLGNRRFHGRRHCGSRLLLTSPLGPPHQRLAVSQHLKSTQKSAKSFSIA